MKLKELIEKNEKKSSKGTYAAYRFNKKDLNKLYKWAKKNKIPNILPIKDMHTTLLYSRKHCPKYDPLGTLDSPISAIIESVEVWKGQDGKDSLVVLLKSPAMSARHKHLMDTLDATYDYDEYKPHITISYDVGKRYDPKKLTKIQDDISKIKAIKEYGEILILDWQNQK